MSRIGLQPVAIPDGVTISVADGAVVVKGKTTELSQAIPAGATIEVKDNEALVKVENPKKAQQRAVWGLTRSLLANMVTGVTDGFEKKLEINGVGYGATLKGKDLELKVGFSHPVLMKAIEGVEFSVDGNVISVKGADKQQVGQIASEIRKVRKPEPYKGKGIKYIDEQIRRKAGKVVKAAGE